MIQKNKIYGFYFVALINNWRPIVESQINKLLNSELFKKTNRLYVRIFYQNKTDLDYFKKIFGDDKKIIFSETLNNEYEFGILKKIKELSVSDDFYCYYFHSKGVSKTNDLITSKNITSWREYMEYFIIEKYELCLKEIMSNWDAAGVKLRRTPNTNYHHFSGNFWWSKSDFIKKLPEIDSMDLKKRHNAEFWIGYSNGKLKCVHNTGQASYKTIISENYRL